MLGFKLDRQNPCCLFVQSTTERQRQSRPKLTNHQENFNHFQNWLTQNGITNKQKPVRTACSKTTQGSPKFVTNCFNLPTFRNQEKKKTKLKCTHREIAKQSRSFKNYLEIEIFATQTLQNGASLFRTKRYKIWHSFKILPQIKTLENRSRQPGNTKKKENIMLEETMRR